ncbi:hypothetical protein ACFPZ0_11865 [Streptomonospora nanhaiensis]|uniref:Uncharacterized protein n=1 Tax=Streptomonospora nanhaiensis TaxID=1323731 RepID=A0A853BKT5_9ACTN|nr:hypothetical protein [Streptomonospora nanhaiensis]MBV2362957.1 hypothetical protein [Streptomonospora nanhaiensis]MBX9388962.1 hypothetical protein [Streptomonospora nanhaiensis]NYI95324.1 hypothetical protein [Streptomonospora nanhaiensis]
MADSTDKAAHDARSLAVFAEIYLREFADHAPQDFAFADLDTRAVLAEAHRRWTGTTASLAYNTDSKKGIRTHSILVPRDLAALAAEVAKTSPLAAAAVEEERLRRYDPQSRDHLAERGRISERIGSLLVRAGHLGGAALKYRAAQDFLAAAGEHTEARAAGRTRLRVLDRLVRHLEARQDDVRAASASADDPVAFNSAVGRRMRITPGSGGWESELTAARRELYERTTAEYGPLHARAVSAARRLVEVLHDMGKHLDAYRFGRDALDRIRKAGRNTGRDLLRRADETRAQYRERVGAPLAALEQRVQRARVVSAPTDPNESGYLGGERGISGPPGGVRRAVVKAAQGVSPGRRAHTTPALPAPRGARRG